MRFSPPATSLRLTAGLAGVAFVVLSSACTTGDARREAALLQRPPMPKVVPPPQAPVVTVSESDALSAALAAVRASDFPATQRALETLFDRTVRDRVTLSVVEAIAVENPSQAAALAVALPPGSTQFAAVKIAAHARARKDSAEALNWALSLSDPDLAGVARRAIVEDLVRTEPATALNRLRALPSSPARDETLSLAVAAWAHRDPEASLAWSRAVADEALRQRLTFSVVFAISQRTPARAAELAGTLPLGLERGLVYSAIAQTWVATDTPAAMAWARQLPAGELRDAALAGVDTGTGAAGPRRHNSGPRLNGGTRMGGTAVAVSLPEPSLPAFTTWLEAQIRPMSRDEAIIEFIKQRGALDVGAIGNWVTTLPGGPTRQRAVETYFEETIRTSPAAAANWLRSVPPSDRTDAMVEEVARRWLQTEPSAAADWLRQSNLPQFRKEEILRSR